MLNAEDSQPMDMTSRLQESFNAVISGPHFNKDWKIKVLTEQKYKKLAELHDLSSSQMVELQYLIQEFEHLMQIEQLSKLANAK